MFLPFTNLGLVILMKNMKLPLSNTILHLDIMEEMQLLFWQSLRQQKFY